MEAAGRGTTGGKIGRCDLSELALKSAMRSCSRARCGVTADLVAARRQRAADDTQRPATEREERVTRGVRCHGLRLNAQQPLPGSDGVDRGDCTSELE